MSRKALVESLLVGALILLLQAPTAQALNLDFAQCGLADVHYKVVDLGAFAVESSAIALNDADQVTGSAQSATGGTRAFLWECDSGLEDIGSLDAGESQAFAINNRGDVVGYSSLADGASAFIWNHEQGMRPIGNDSARGYDINDWRDVMVSNEGGDVHEGPSLWNPRSGPRFLHELFGFEPMGEPRINNRRLIGGAQAVEGGFRFFHWTSRGGVREIASWLGSAHSVRVAAMNDRGDMLVQIYEVDGRDESILALVSADAGLKVLADRVDFNSEVVTLNNKRQVVLILSSIWYLWDEQNGLRPLPDLVSGTPTDALSAQPAGINNWGWLVGTRYVPETNSIRAAMFVPVSTHSQRFDNLSQLTGARLCRALQAIKVEALRSCLFEGR
jgi:probable HAF family extracellular repeat protein